MADDLMVDAVDRYNRQLDIVDRLRAAWIALGCPTTAEGGATGRATVVHPLVLEIQQAELRANTLWKATVDARKRGRPVGASSAVDRRARLKAV